MMRPALRVLIVLLTLLFGPGAGAQDHEKNPFRVSFDDQVVKTSPGQTFEFSVQFKVPASHYLYEEKTSVLFEKTDGLAVLKTQAPEPEEHYDRFLKKNTKVFFRDFKVTVYFLVPEGITLGRKTLEAMVRYQGCSEDFCYKPVKQQVLLPVEVVDPGQAIVQAPTSRKSDLAPPAPSPLKEPSILEMVRETNPEKLLDRGKIYLLGLAMLGGVLTSFTPCVLPIIPLTLAFIGVRHKKKGNLMRAALLVLGMVAMYSLLGFLAATLGLKLGFLFQSRYFVLATALFFLLFALGLFEIIPFHLPPKLHNRVVRMGGEGPLGAFVAGLTVGLIASPCVGPLIAPLLLIAARQQDRIYGLFLLFSYGLGMGILFLALGSAYAKLAGRVRSGKWTHHLKRALGLLMLAPAIYYGMAFARPYFGREADALWVYDFKQGIQLARETGKPVLLDYYADWCPPCLELDKRTFSTPEVREAAKDFVMLKVDCSFDSANCQGATEKYEVVGWPTVLFLKWNGQLIEDVKLVGGFADKDQMLKLMREALQKAK